MSNERKWTEGQKRAIESTGGSILVSAAAGSGKTAVLVERVIRRITNKDNPCPADALLIVTFTKAAANEMRERIYKALKEKIRKEPNNAYLREQEMLLPNADICTMDSFCSALVKENFRLADISPDFKILSDSELTVMETEAIDTVLEREYKKGDKAFLDLSEQFYTTRDDSALVEAIIQLYHYSRAYAFPDEWLDSLVKAYDPQVPLVESCWGKSMLDYAMSVSEHAIYLLEEMDAALQRDDYDEGDEDDGLDPYRFTGADDRGRVYDIYSALLDKDWDLACEKIQNGFMRKRPIKADLRYEEKPFIWDQKRSILLKSIKSLKEKGFCITQAQYTDDAAFFEPMIEKLTECVKQFEKEFFRLKKEKNGYDFSDIAHIALDLLAKSEDGKVTPTPLAKEISKRYMEILIDEYQDTNEQQHILFNAISKDGGNLFRVGDAKQSIYAFRQAMPEIFIGMRNELEEYDSDNYPAKITLDRNFRSRKGVADFINFVFEQVMSEQVGGVDYGDGEALVAKASYPESDEPEAELHIIDMRSPGNAEMDKDRCEGRHIAAIISDMVSRGVTVGKIGSERPIQYKDICILMRAVKGKTISMYTEELRRRAIPYFVQTTGSFFSSSEIAVMLSLLRVIDNPNQDIPLLSALMSPIFAFTADETAKMRIANPKASLYACLIENESKDEKVANFLKFFRKMRFLAGTCTAAELIHRIFEETSYAAIVQAMEGGELRYSNLMLLVDYAEMYEKSGMIGLSGFIRFIDRLFEKKKELNASTPVSEDANVVKIMTIHGSKGLEFPVCILANTEKHFNSQDEKKRMIIDPNFGVGMSRRDSRTKAKYSTLPQMCAKLRMNMRMKSEEMRLLYVAMTRAEEKLIMVSAEKKDCNNTFQKVSADVELRSFKYPASVVLDDNRYIDWILKGAIRHTDALRLRIGGCYDTFDTVVKKPSGRLKVEIVYNVDKTEQSTDKAVRDEVIDPEMQKFIDDRVNFRYKYASLSSIATKRVASQIDGRLIDRENFATAKPDFLREGKLTAAQKGTATHKFMQYCDFTLAKESVTAEAQRLAREEILTPEEANEIRVSEIESFFASDLYAQIEKSNTVMREKKFTVNVPAEWVYPQIEEMLGESIMIQGMVDCAFIEDGKVVVVDYKTDRADKDEYYIASYSEQLRIYKHALEQITGLPVSQTSIYSFKLSKIIEIS